MESKDITEVTRVIRGGELVSIVTGGPIYAVLSERIPAYHSAGESWLDRHRSRYQAHTAEELYSVLSEKATRDYDQISPIHCDLGFFWLAGITHTHQLQQIQKVYQFDCIISLTNLMSLDVQLVSDKILHQRFSVHDEPTLQAAGALKKAMPAIFEMLDTQLSAGKRVLLHCAAGVSRSPTVAVAYLIYRDRLRQKKGSLGDYLEYMQACRSCVNPNIEFLRLLHQLTSMKGWETQ